MFIEVDIGSLLFRIRQPTSMARKDLHTQNSIRRSSDTWIGNKMQPHPFNLLFHES